MPVRAPKDSMNRCAGTRALVEHGVSIGKAPEDPWGF
jgi:hypothetical protein